MIPKTYRIFEGEEDFLYLLWCGWSWGWAMWMGGAMGDIGGIRDMYGEQGDMDGVMNMDVNEGSRYGWNQRWPKWMG